MSHDDVPLPTNQKRRRSIFDDYENERIKPKNEDEGTNPKFPEGKAEIYYPAEYVEKVRTEIEQWKMHISKTLEENNKFKTEKKELQKMIVNENILTTQQHDVMDSLKFEEYTRRVKNFCDRAGIIAHKIRTSESELETQYMLTQEELEKQIILNEHFADNKF